MQITTSKGPEITNAYVKTFRHGISCVDAIGGYSKKHMYLLHTVVSSYEVEDIITPLHEVDDHVSLICSGPSSFTAVLPCPDGIGQSCFNGSVFETHTSGIFSAWKPVKIKEENRIEVITHVSG